MSGNILATEGNPLTLNYYGQESCHFGQNLDPSSPRRRGSSAMNWLSEQPAAFPPARE
jgi:hypothetical protein